MGGRAGLTQGLRREGRCCQASGMRGHKHELMPSMPPSAAGLGQELSGEHCPELAAMGWDGWDGWDGWMGWMAGIAGMTAFSLGRGLCTHGQAPLIWGHP